jgi:hypothetical protein
LTYLETLPKLAAFGWSGLQHMNERLPARIPAENEIPEVQLPRWVQIPAGLTLALLTLGCGFASVSMLVVPNEKSPVLTAVVGSILLLGCLWILEKCVRLILGRRNRGGLMTPNTLRVVSCFLLALPIAGLFTGYYRKMGAIAILQAVMYCAGFLGLQALARARETRAATVQKSHGDR